MTDHALGNALDNAEYGANKLFAEVDFEVALEGNLLNLTKLAIHFTRYWFHERSPETIRSKVNPLISSNGHVCFFVPS